MSRRRRAFGRVSQVLAVLVAGAGCASDHGGSATTVAMPPVTAGRCIVRLHGKGEQGGDSTLEGGIATVRPNGNAAGWGKRQWLYFPDDRYDGARTIVEAALDSGGCTTAVISGFSNGGSFAAKLYCRGETFDGRVVGYVIDDPVTDSAVLPCEPAQRVKAALYWTGALAASAPAGAICSAMDWTCEGDASIGIDAYAAGLGLPIQKSPQTEHLPDNDAPELSLWLE
jgi:hypothetical protein